MSARRLRRTRTRPTRTAARTALQGGITTTLSRPMEQRLVVVAQGVQFPNSALPNKADYCWQVPDCLWDDASILSDKLKIPGLNRTSASLATYTNAAQRVRYTIRVTTDKQRFHEYLEGRRGRATFGNNVLVIYAGHARYGRGPCFGATKDPGHHWGTGSDPRTEGIFRLGYPYLQVPCTEILGHGYWAEVAREQTSDPNRSAVDLRRVNRSRNIHPHLRPHLGSRSRTRSHSLAELDTLLRSFHDSVTYAKSQHTALQNVPTDRTHGYLKSILENIDENRRSFATYIAGSTNDDERFWATMRYKKVKGYYKDAADDWYRVTLSNPRRRSGKFAWPHIILHADWRNTKSGTWRSAPAAPPARMDLGATRMNCRGFCHFGCSTMVHNYPIMRYRTMKNWRRAPDRNDRLCYWTTEAAKGDITPYWLYHMLTYIPGRWRGFATRGWGDTLSYARNRTNSELALDDRNYRVS